VHVTGAAEDVEASEAADDAVDPAVAEAVDPAVEAVVPLAVAVDAVPDAVDAVPDAVDAVPDAVDAAVASEAVEGSSPPAYWQMGAALIEASRQSTSFQLCDAELTNMIPQSKLLKGSVMSGDPSAQLVSVTAT